jgi:hypothetical protein
MLFVKGGDHELRSFHEVESKRVISLTPSKSDSGDRI